VFGLPCGSCLATCEPSQSSCGVRPAAAASAGVRIWLGARCADGADGAAEAGVNDPSSSVAANAPATTAPSVPRLRVNVLIMVSTFRLPSQCPAVGDLLARHSLLSHRVKVTLLGNAITASD